MYLQTGRSWTSCADVFHFLESTSTNSAQKGRLRNFIDERTILKTLNCMFQADRSSLKSVELRSKRKMLYPLGFWITKISLLGRKKYSDTEKPKFIKYRQGFSTVLHTLLRSGACGLEGLTGTESPAADGIYITGPVCVGLDTAEDCCKSSLSAGSGRNKSTHNVTQSCTIATDHKTFRNKNT